jgi:carbonic anhydrase
VRTVLLGCCTRCHPHYRLRSACRIPEDWLREDFRHHFQPIESILMQKLVEGIHQFQNEVFSSRQRLFERLVEGQHPLALFITCSDSRIDPSLLTQTEPGELFILRNAGNIVPPYGTINGGEAATIEFAVSALGVKDIVICGHSHCGAMKGVLAPESLDDLPAVRNWLSYADATQRIMRENYEHISEATARLTATVQENVLVQLEHLRTHPSVAAALGRKELKLHGWVYKFETGQVFAYRPDDSQFVPVEGTSFAVPSATRELPPI